MCVRILDWEVRGAVLASVQEFYACRGLTAYSRVAFFYRIKDESISCGTENEMPGGQGPPGIFV
jgi:hypothetical protein